MRRMKFAVVLLAVASLAFAFVACSDDDDNGDNGGDTPAPAATTPMAETPVATSETPAAGETPGPVAAVEVNLTEWIVAPEPTAVPAGTTTFNAHNIGGEPHEIVIIRTDLLPDGLPTAADGSVDEAGAGIEVIDEIEEFASGTDQSLTIDLEAGNYALICNVVTDAGVSHYDSGMRTAFTVNS